MKRFFATIVMVLGFAVAAGAMSYRQAREQALFLTDKMAYELNLTDDQYDAAYEINLDYLMSVNSYDELYGDYWRWRNLDLSYVLLDWQYRAFCAAAYFYRPLYFDAGCWHFAIYARYPHRDYFYFHRPTVYVSYRGGHSWHQNNGRSWYSGRTFGSRRGGEVFGMRDRFDRGDFGRGQRQSFGSRSTSSSVRRENNGFGSSRGNGGFGGRESSTRTTVRQPESGSQTQRVSGFGSRRDNSSRSSSITQAPSSTFRPSSTQRSSSSFGSSRSSSSSFGSSRSNGSSFSSPSPSFGGGSRGGASGSSSRGGGFGSRR